MNITDLDLRLHQYQRMEKWKYGDTDYEQSTVNVCLDCHFQKCITNIKDSSMC